jgi:hypothetical protein
MYSTIVRVGKRLKMFLSAAALHGFYMYWLPLVEVPERKHPVGSVDLTCSGSVGEYRGSFTSAGGSGAWLGVLLD